MCRALGAVYAGADFLGRLDLVPAPKTCPRHAQPFLGMRCAACTAVGVDASTSVGLCAACVSEHALAHPTHALALFAPNVSALRAQLVALVAAPAAVIPDEPAAAVDGTALIPAPPSDAGGVGDGSRAPATRAPEQAAPLGVAPLVQRARRKALAAQVELDALAAHEEAVLSQFEANRDAAMAELQARFADSIDATRAAAATKRTSLQAELVTADAAIDKATTTAAALSEVW